MQSVNWQLVRSAYVHVVVLAVVLTMPNWSAAAAPNDDGNGYTNLEEWRHVYAADVESTFNAMPTASSSTAQAALLNRARCWHPVKR